jgi:hypothetical protein
MIHQDLFPENAARAEKIKEKIASKVTADVKRRARESRASFMRRRNPLSASYCATQRAPEPPTPTQLAKQLRDQYRQLQNTEDAQ